MKDLDLENQINVKLDDWTYQQIVGAQERTLEWKSEIVRKCIRKCIRQDRAPKWKRWIARVIRY